MRTSRGPELYDAADEAGLLLWQDLPLQWGYARGIRKQAVQQATAAVDLLGHHPSIAIWCGHNEPMAIDSDPTRRGDPKALRRLAVKAAAAQELPTWNKTVLDRSVKRALEKADGTRPVIAHSGVLPHPPQLDGTDSHLYFGWYHGHERDFPGFLRAMPRMARFVTEFGAQAVTDDAPSSASRSAGRTSTGSASARTHALQRPLFDRHVPPTDHPTFDEWRAATQAYQAVVVRRHIEALRRIKYRPTGGFAQFCFADGHPAVTWSVLGHDRAPEGGVRRAARGLPAGDRRRRPAAGAGDRRPGPGPRRARGERPAHPGRRRPGHRRLDWHGGSRTLAVARRHPRRRVPAGRHGADRRARRARPDGARAPTATTTASRWTTGTTATITR